MTANKQHALPLVRAAAIEPSVCRRTALAIAAAADDAGGTLAASMSALASLVGLSTAQVRKHVHALIAMGVIEVTANAHGGAPGTVPHYRFNELRLRALAQQSGRTSDLFEAIPIPRMSFMSEDEAGERQHMAIELHGRPGQRFVKFFLQSTQGDVPYGWAPLQILLMPCLTVGSWTGWLNPDAGAPEGCLSVCTFPETVEELRHWAQSAALGRVESTETA